MPPAGSGTALYCPALAKKAAKQASTSFDVTRMSCSGMTARSSSREVRISWYPLFCFVYFSRVPNPSNQKRNGEKGLQLLGDLGRHVFCLGSRRLPKHGTLGWRHSVFESSWVPNPPPPRPRVWNVACLPKSQPTKRCAKTKRCVKDKGLTSQQFTSTPA